jgi:hypothetical protein
MATELPALTDDVQGAREAGVARTRGRSSPSQTLWIAVLAAIALQLGYAAVSSDRDLYSIFRDDAFYYFVIAKHIVTKHLSSFDGVVPTNGYHPLWLVVLLPIVSCLGDSPRIFLLAVLVAGAASAVGCVALLLRLTPRLVGTRSAQGDDAVVVVFGTACAMAVILQFTFLGMETVLALPALLVAASLLFELLSDPALPSRKAIALGLGLAVLCLSRLDAMLFGAVAGALVVWNGRARPVAMLRALACMAAGASPLFLYFAYNQAHYGHLMTTSAMAKNLAPGLRVNLAVLGFLFSPPVAPFVLIGAAGGVLVLRRDLWPGTAARQTAGALVVFAFGYFAILAFTSNWQLWRWYLYPLAPTVAVGAAMLVRWVRGLKSAPSVPAGALALAASCALPPAVLALSLLSRGNIAAGIFDSARQLAAFERTHPGRYAMGDAAGVPGFLMQRPPLQLEGLVGDYALLEHIRRRDPLNTVLREYGVDYFIDRGPDDLHGQCRTVTVPGAKQAGADSPKMAGTFCGNRFDLADNLRVFPVSASVAGAAP